MGAFLVTGVVRPVSGEATHGTGATLAGLAVLLLLLWLFALATRGALVRRRDPGQVVVTPSWLVAERVHAQWQVIDAVPARQEHRQGHLRPIDSACVRVEGRTITVYEASQLDVEPRAALEALRRLHRDRALRAQLATDDGPTIFTGSGDDRRVT
ncbi:hypothetical protein LP422_06340 [Janibacter limosus]|uniref:Uncharacterized protein n=1 Tax=Janibacter limosus TaxID=53458 RepID=A0AC61U743_9MICO|nr:hypothetical protein [Janibacter limosus]UUZ45657.1 hypothetical protein LP422_06340 [Janibacter limosus]